MIMYYWSINLFLYVKLHVHHEKYQGNGPSMRAVIVGEREEWMCGKSKSTLSVTGSHSDGSRDTSQNYMKQMSHNYDRHTCIIA